MEATSIFREMHRSHRFGSWKDYNELLDDLKQAIAQGIVQELAPSSHMAAEPCEKWFLEKSTGTVFRLLEPNPPGCGEWSEVQFPERPVC